MKKVLLPALAALFIVGMTSCKKDWDCTCKGDVAGVAFESTVTLRDLTKSDAEDACSASASTFGTSISCSLD
jgi:hypothetical protein